MNALILYLLVLFLPIIATIGIEVTYGKYKKVSSNKDLTGFDVAKKILDNNGLDNIYIVETNGNLTDNYDSSRKVIHLSSDVYHGNSLASIAVAAHECGHAIQDKENYSWMRIRSAIYPVVSFGEKIAYIFLFIGLIIGSMGAIYASIIITLLSLIFELVTLPVEFDASKRAYNLLISYNLINKDEESGVLSVLKAAAFTYVASALSSLFYILYLLSDNRD